MKKLILITFTILFMVFTAFGEVLENSDQKIISSIKDLTTEAFYNFDESLYYQSMGLCERVLTNDSKNEDALYYSAYTCYRLANIAMTNNNVSQLNNYAEKGIEQGELLKNSNEFGAEIRVVLAAIYMMKLTVNQDDAPVLSTKIHRLLGEAEGMDNSNPRVHLIRGIMLFHTPPQFGGSVLNAMKEFDKTIELFDYRIDDEKIIWGKYEAYAWKGMALQKQGKDEEARKVYELAIKEEPNFGWIKYKLLPSLNNTSSK